MKDVGQDEGATRSRGALGGEDDWVIPRRLLVQPPSRTRESLRDKLRIRCRSTIPGRQARHSSSALPPLAPTAPGRLLAPLPLLRGPSTNDSTTSYDAYDSRWPTTWLPTLSSHREEQQQLSQETMALITLRLHRQLQRPPHQAPTSTLAPTFRWRVACSRLPRGLHQGPRLRSACLHGPTCPRSRRWASRRRTGQVQPGLLRALLCQQRCRTLRALRSCHSSDPAGQWVPRRRRAGTPTGLPTADAGRPPALSQARLATTHQSRCAQASTTRSSAPCRRSTSSS